MVEMGLQEIAMGVFMVVEVLAVVEMVVVTVTVVTVPV